MGAAMGVLGGMVQAMGAMSAASANAAAEERQAEIAKETAKANASRIQTEWIYQRGSMLAAYGASGAGVSGDVLADAAMSEELNIQSEIWKGETDAQTHLDNANRYRKQGMWNAMSGIVTGVSKGLG